MLNIQPREHRTDKDDLGTSVDVVKCWETLQGEGPFVGMPCVFVRLAGCNLQCQLCDTDYTTGRERVRVAELVDRVGAIRPSGLVVITGGEPFRQNIGPFVQALCERGFCIQIETNGTIYREEFPYSKTMGSFRVQYFAYFGNTIRYSLPSLTLVCSPKAPTVHQAIKPYVRVLKYVIAANNVSRYDGLPTRVLGAAYSIARPWDDFAGRIYLQPEDHQDAEINKRNVEAALTSCFKYGYIFCPQVHKVYGLE